MNFGQSFAGPLVAGCLAAFSYPVSAHTHCGERKAFVDYLASEFREQKTGAGITKNGTVVEMFHSDARATWTITMTDPGTGITCLVAAGSDWQDTGEVEHIDLEI
jgi:hypothetical protein